ncbi:MAG TPA: transposase, partial [Opitutus sp.]|nr:transposase [Opitutus sp.]
MTWIVNDGAIFDHLPRHGNISWAPSQLILSAILWVWSDQAQLTVAYHEAHQAVRGFFPRVALQSYQGFIRALVRWTEPLRPLLWARLHALMEQVAGGYWRCGEYLALAVDGSRVTTPRTKSNERAFAAQNFGRGRKARSRRKWKNKKRRSKKLCIPVKPQIWLTMIWHMGLKMPWCWKTGPSTASERGHFLDLLKNCAFPRKTLFCADAGFVGYELWKAILDGGHDFLIRVGGNVTLLRKLGRVRVDRDLVYFWPKTAQEKKRPPLVLRLLSFSGPRGPVHLLTSVLDARRLSLANARELYRQRWGVELQFRTLKQTFGRSKLRSRTADRALV